MPNFDLAEELDEIRYDFTKYLPDVEDAQGVVPEPSEKQLNKFRKESIRLLSPYSDKLDGDLSAESVSRLGTLLNEAEAEHANQISDKLLRLVSELCSNTPSYATIKALPARAQRLWIGYIMGAFADPKA